MEILDDLEIKIPYFFRAPSARDFDILPHPKYVFKEGYGLYEDYNIATFLSSID